LQKNVFILFFFILFFLTIQVGKSQDTIRSDVKDTIVMFSHSPTRAAIMSAVVPGMGQIYNKKYWKVPLVYGGLGTLGYFIIHFNNLYQKYLNAYIQYNKFGNKLILHDLPNFNFEYPDVNRQLVWYKDTYRRWRDMDIMLFGAVYILNIIDATVDAYLFNYDISEDLSIRIEPTFINTYASKGTPGFKLSLKLW
jgi:hypothetical protein